MYEKQIRELNPSIPEDGRVSEYYKMQYIVPSVYGGWRPETLSWKQAVYLGANLSTEMPCMRLKGPDAVRLLNENTVNNFANMKIGSGRHTIFCSEKGNIITDGIALRFAEDEFGCFALQPMVTMLANSGRYKVEPIEVEPQDFLFQIAGPRSLETLGRAAKEDLHDIGFMRFRYVTIAGQRTRILRVGMAGTLAYEAHGGLKGAQDVYNAIWEAGQPYGIEKLGFRQYASNHHAESGYPQSGLHFLFAWADQPDLVAMFSGVVSTEAGAIGKTAPMSPMNVKPGGSLSDNINDYYRNPFELGWGKMVKFDHEFVGRKALEKIAADTNTYAPATLTWDPLDVCDITASFFRTDAEPYKELTFPQEIGNNFCGRAQYKVLNTEGKLVGKASNPVYTLYYRKEFSFATIEPAYNRPGAELTLVWGDPGDRKKNVRVRVDRYPLLDLTPNQEYDIENIPRYKG
jgi:glycine cleavage system aminomethyltransferase T